MYVRFKPLYTEDKEWFYSIATSSDATPYWYGEWYNTEVPSRKAFFDDWKDVYFSDDRSERGRCYAIEVKDRRVGVITHGPVNQEESSTELDILIAKAGDTGKGYGSRSLSRFAAYLYSTLGVRRCWIAVSSRNSRALRACRNAGFVRKGVKSNAQGEWVIFEKEFQLE